MNQDDLVSEWNQINDKLENLDIDMSGTAFLRKLSEIILRELYQRTIRR